MALLNLDAVELVLDDKVVKFAEEYTVHTSVLAQPSNFTIKIAHKGPPADVIADFPPRTRFELRMGGLQQFNGWIDGYEVNDGEDGTDVVFQGRDYLAPLASGYVTSDQSFKQTSAHEMVRRGLDAVGLRDAILVVSNQESLQRRTGAKIGSDGFTQERQFSKVNKAITAKAGDKWLDFILRELKRQGLFVWAAPSGNVVLGAPNGKQMPLYRIVRHPDRGIGTNITGRLHNNAENRGSEAIVIAGGGKRGARQFLAAGAYLDREMIAWNYNQPIVFRDVHAANEEQAEFYARRKLAETRRSGWNLTYTVPGHATPSIFGDQYYIWNPDTCVEVDDSWLGIKGKFWIESCEYKGSESGRTTTLVLQRPDDLIFAEDA